MSAEPGIAKPSTPAPLQTAEVLSLDCITFGVAAGVEPSGKPPVRIFLGSEEAQQRAERVFLYTVRKHRDPTRIYQVYLMKDLPGFDRRIWRTGFTQYRFAIPELAGGSGRAIYNDVDQIYLTDPAELFDLDMDGHGYLSVAAIDTSVVLMDCARMLPWWNMAAARQLGKRELVHAPAAEPGLLGTLAGGWNARDFEYQAGVSGLLHYTTLYLQPWRPAPDAYSYHPNPLGHLWFDLEREADAQNYRPFTRVQPSRAYERLLGTRRAAGNPAQTSIGPQARDFLVTLGRDTQAMVCSLDVSPIGAPQCFNPALQTDWPSEPQPAVVVGDTLEQLPASDVPWFLDALFALAQNALYLQIDLRRAVSPDDRPAPARLRKAGEWWPQCIAAAAERHPSVAWQLDLVEPGGTRRRFRHQPPDAPPKVWVLLGRHEGDNRQMLALADALGWPCETRQLVFKGGPNIPPLLQGESLWRLDRGRSETLAPPWPDLVLASGRRSVPVARWIRRQSGGTTRLVHLGRPCAALDLFDLVVTTPQYRLPARDNVLHNVLPLNRQQPERTERALAMWRSRIEALPRPRIALLAGGDSTSCVLGEQRARQLREQAEQLAQRSGGSLLVTTSPRTARAAADALLADSDVPGLRYRWHPNDPDNPYPAFLELADELIITGDSASMIAEACAGGRPVRFVALPHPRPDRLDLVAFLEKCIEGRRGPQGERGTPRQQNVLGRRLDDLIAAGLLWPQRDLTKLHEALLWSGRARPLDADGPAVPPPASSDLDRTVTAVRRLFLRGREVRT